MAVLPRVRDELLHDRRAVGRASRALQASAVRERRADAAQLLLLLVVAFLPFPTRLVAEALPTDLDAERAAVLFYGATLLVISVIMTAMWTYAARRPELLVDGVAPTELRRVSARTRPTLTFYGLILLLAALAPRVAAFGFLAVSMAAIMLPASRRAVER